MKEKKRETRRKERDRNRASQIKERVRFPTKGERGKRLGVGELELPPHRTATPTVTIEANLSRPRTLER